MKAVLYHAHCADGFGGAYAAWRALGDEATYLPVQYGGEVPEIAPGTDAVWMIDFSYPRDQILALHTKYPKLVILDHHRTAQADLAGLDFAIFDMDKSGAVLAWEHFHPGEPVPMLLRYVQDRDLWTWKLPDSREVSAGLWSYPMNFATWDGLIRRVDRLADEGAGILRYMKQQTEMIISQAKRGELAGHIVPICNATSLWSEVGEALCERYPDDAFAAAYYDLSNGLRKWSLRSRGEFDVSAIARQLGGGGHRNAAGFVERLP